MAVWPTMRRVVTLLVLLLAATEIFACQLISPDSCIFSSHSTPDTSEGGSGDGCLCCCAHIVVVPPITPVALLASFHALFRLTRSRLPNSVRSISNILPASSSPYNYIDSVSKEIP